MLRISHIELVAKRKLLLALLAGLIHSVFAHLPNLYGVNFGSFANCRWYIQIRRGKSRIIRADSEIDLRNSWALGLFLIVLFLVVLLLHDNVAAALRLNCIEVLILRLSSIHGNEVHRDVEGASASQNFMLFVTDIYAKIAGSIEKLCIFAWSSKDRWSLSRVAGWGNKGPRAHCHDVLNVATLRWVLVGWALVNNNWGRCSLIQKLCRTLLSYR